MQRTFNVTLITCSNMTTDITQRCPKWPQVPGIKMSPNYFILHSWFMASSGWAACRPSLHLLCSSNVRELCSVCPCPRPRLSGETQALSLLLLLYRTILGCLSIKAGTPVRILNLMPLVFQVSFLCSKSTLWLSCVLCGSVCSSWWDYTYSLSSADPYVFSVVARLGLAHSWWVSSWYLNPIL